MIFHDHHVPSSLDRSSGVMRARSATLPYVAMTVIVLGGVGYAARTWLIPKEVREDLTCHVIQPRNFMVTLREKGELVASNSLDVKCEVEGHATIIWLIPEGTQAKEGDLLVELASNEIDDQIQSEELKVVSALAARDAARTEYEIQLDQNKSDIEKAELQVNLASLALEKYEKGDWAQALRDADIEIERADISLERRQDEVEASEKLAALNYITKAELEEDRFSHKQAIWEREKAERSKEVLIDYTHRMDMLQKESDLTEAKSELERVKKNAEAERVKKEVALQGREKELQIIEQRLARLRLQKKNCRLVAPGSGMVVYPISSSGRWSNEDQIKEGASVRERQTLISLVDMNRMNVLARVHESKTDRIQVGQPVNVQVEGVPGYTFPGSIVKIGVLAESQNRWLNPDLKEYEVQIELEETAVPLKPGVTAVAEILVERVENALSVPVQCVFSKNGRNYVFLNEDGDVKPVEVGVGAAGVEWAQLMQGASLGARVLMAATDDHLRKLPDLPPPSNDRWKGVTPPASMGPKTARREGPGGPPSKEGPAVKEVTAKEAPATGGSPSHARPSSSQG